MLRSPSTFVTRLIEFASQEDDAPAELVIPSDLSALSIEDLRALHTQAVAEFDSVYQDGAGLSPDEVVMLTDLATAIETVTAEVSAREVQQTERDTAAAELASRVRVEPVEAATDEAAAATDEEEDEDDADESATVDAELLVAGASPRSEIRVNLSGVRSRQRRGGDSPRPSHEARRMQDVMIAADVPGFTSGEGLDWNGVGRAVDRRLAVFNQSQYEAAAGAGLHLREQHGVAVIRKPFAEDMIIRNSDPDHVDEVLRRAMDESRLPGGSLVASGGWCAPSETLYDLFELETRDGLFSLPEVGVARGGIKWTAGPDFASIYAAVPGFKYTEQNDIDGKYAVDASGAGTGATGTKPVYKVGCPSWLDKRLGLYGLAITAGLLEQRGFPEYIARTVRGAFVAHDHRMSKMILDELVTGSTAVAMTTGQVGSVAPLLDSIELQVEHYRYVHRLGRSTTLEAVFPFWVRGALRSDLARRLGSDIEFLSVTDAMIDGWFRERGIAPQYVYNFQDLTGAAGSFKAWPSTVSFLLYSAGTWVKGGSDVITLDTIYDSVLLGTNDYTALFTEEGWLTAKMGHDSRSVTVPLSPTGMTGQGVHMLPSGVEDSPKVPAILSADVEALIREAVAAAMASASHQKSSAK